MPRLLLLDDELNVLHALRRTLRQEVAVPGLEVELFTDPFAALARISQVEFDVAISDFRMPQMSGVEFLFALKEVAPTTVRMMLSASTEFDTVTSAISEAQVFRYLAKPWQVDGLRSDLLAALAYRVQLLEQQRLAEQERSRALSPQEQEARRLEAEEPGLLKVKWGPNGEIIL